MTPDDTRHGSKAQRETAEDNLQDAHQRLEDYGKTVNFLDWPQRLCDPSEEGEQ